MSARFTSTGTEGVSRPARIGEATPFRTATDDSTTHPLFMPVSAPIDMRRLDMEVLRGELHAAVGGPQTSDTRLCHGLARPFSDASHSHGTASPSALSRPRVPDQTAPSGDDCGPSPLRILIVDDNAAVRRADSIRLQRLGHDTTTCSCARQALQMINASPDTVDLVLTDQVMPRMDGLTLARHVRDTNAGVRVVIMSGHSTHLTTERAEAAGVDAILWKPFGTEEVSTVLDTIARP